MDDSFRRGRYHLPEDEIQFNSVVNSRKHHTSSPPSDGPPTPRLAAGQVDIASQLYPYAIVWGPLPCITCMCPCVGHMGIGDSQGKIHDFAGSNTIGIGRFMVGSVWRYRVFKEAANDPDRWDSAINSADKQYRQRCHNIFCDNCHHHSAMALKEWDGKARGQVTAWLDCCLHGRCTWCPH